MKIDFTGSYKEVIQHVSAPVTPGKDTLPADTFPDLLSSIAPGTQLQKPAAVEPLLTPQPPRSPAELPLARMNLTSPALKPPTLERLAAPEIEPALAPEPDISLNPPSIIDVRRIKSAEKLNSLPKEERVSAVADMVARAGAKHGVDPALSIAVIAAESGFDAAAISQDGHSSKGLMQLLDGTGLQLLKRAGLETKYDPFNPEQNVDLGVGYLRHLHDTFSTPTTLAPDVATRSAANSASLEKLAVAAFNAGEGRVAAAQGRTEKAGGDPASYGDVAVYLPKTTQEYVDRVLRFKSTFEREASAESAGNLS
jgi:soluble lytic murein transglycosylase-like protein